MFFVKLRPKYRGLSGIYGDPREKNTLCQVYRNLLFIDLGRVQI